MPLLTPADSTQATIAKKQTRRGTALMEYLMMLSLIVVACMVAIGYLGTSNSGTLSSSSNAINNSLQNGNFQRGQQEPDEGQMSSPAFAETHVKNRTPPS